MSWSCPECNIENHDNLIKCYCGYRDTPHSIDSEDTISSPIEFEEERLNISSKKIKLIGAFEILGGLSGIFLLLEYKLQPTIADNLSITFEIITLLLYLLTIIAGYLLWKENRLGIVLSKVIQSLQLPHIFTSFFIFEFVSGFKSTLLMSFPTIKMISIKFFIGSSFLFNIGENAIPSTIGINLIPFIILIYLFSIKEA